MSEKDYEDYGESASFTTPSAYNDFRKIAGEKLGAHVLSYSGFHVSGASTNRRWENALNCNYIPGLLKMLRGSKTNYRTHYCTGAICADFKLPEADEKSVTYCTQMTQLQTCLETYYKVARKDYNSDRFTDEDTKETFEELFDLDPTLDVDSSSVQKEN